MKDRARHPGERLVRRYDNRKLYDVHARRYVTLDGLARLVADGTDVRVVEQKTGEDITTLVLAQVVLEGIRQRTARIPHEVLARLIRLGNGSAGGFSEWVDAQDAAARTRKEAERIVSGLVARGRLSLDEALALRQEIATSAQRMVAEAQTSLQARFRRLIEGTGEGVTPALQALKDRLTAFDTLLEPRARPARGRKPRARKATR
jgi:polyhydroxyalkanoate synthesis repressor PhaR